MKEEIVKSLKDLIHPLSDVQKDFLFARIWGMNRRQASKLVHRSPETTIYVWAKTPYKEIEKYVLKHIVEYFTQAIVLQLEDMSLTARLAFKNLVERSRDWESIPKALLPHVVRAVMFLMATSKKQKELESEDYDEWLENQKKQEG